MPHNKGGAEVAELDIARPENAEISMVMSWWAYS